MAHAVATEPLHRICPSASYHLAHVSLPLQVLLSQVHRLRALVLLGRFLDMGPWAVDQALGVGIFPYVLKLLQTTSADLRSTLVFIWCKVLALDPSCQVRVMRAMTVMRVMKVMSPVLHELSWIAFYS